MRFISGWGWEDAVQDEPWRLGAEIRVGSLIVVVPQEAGAVEDHACRVSIIQQSPVIIKKSRGDQPTDPRYRTNEWI